MAILHHPHAAAEQRDKRLPIGRSVTLIGSLSVLSWMIVITIVSAVGAVL